MLRAPLTRLPTAGAQAIVVQMILYHSANRKRAEAGKVDKKTK